MLNAGFDDKISRGLDEVSRLRRFSGTPSEFWPAFVAAAAGVTSAERGILILKDLKDNTWKKLSEWNASPHADRAVLSFNRALIELGEQSMREGNCLRQLEMSTTPDLAHFAVAVRLALNRPDDACVACYLILNTTERQARESLVRLQLVADTPFSYLLNHSSNQAKTDVEKFAASLDVMALLNEEKKFLGATLALCNAAASRYACDRVSLGWVERGYVRLKSISRTERFDKNMAAVKALELTMEEALDQDDEIIWPEPDGASFISRDHEKFAQSNSSGNICSVPIRVDQKPVGVLTLERKAKPFSAAETQQFRLACDQAARRLSDLREKHGWVGARAARGLRAGFARVLGPEKTWMKVLALLGTAAVAILFFGQFNYRVEGNFILKSDAVAYITAPFDGYLKEVTSKPGDLLKQDSLLLQMDTDELAIEEANAIADQVRYQREAEKARATNGLAEMRISQSLAEQAKARLDMARHRLRQSTIRAPFDGVLVEGDLRERLGAPVKQGDALFKVTRMEGMYVEAEINQRDVHNIKAGSPAEIAFVTQPKLKYKVKVDRIYPAAFPKEGENIFIVRLALLDKPSEWWRPGMSGLVKIEAGERPLYWILTHRTIDFLRMWLWW